MIAVTLLVGFTNNKIEFNNDEIKLIDNECVAEFRTCKNLPKTFRQHDPPISIRFYFKTSTKKFKQHDPPISFRFYFKLRSTAV